MSKTAKTGQLDNECEWLVFKVKDSWAETDTCS